MREKISHSPRAYLKHGRDSTTGAAHTRLVRCSRNVVRLEAHDIRDRVCGNKYSTACLWVKRGDCDSGGVLVANTWYRCELSVRPSDVL